MIKCNDWPISVCTWSLGNDLDKISVLGEQTRISHLNLALLPALGKEGENYLSRIQAEGWQIPCTMINFPQEDYSTLESIKATGGIVPEQYWQANRQMVLDAIDLTVQLGVKYLLFHFGFFEHTDSENAGKFRDKVQLLADAAADKNIMLLMETGQETAKDLRTFLEETNHPALGVNFDPANMILYDKGNPIEAVQVLAPWIKHIHAKDAVKTKTSGTWGIEVVLGTGQVGFADFLRTLKEINFAGALAIEREAGDNRLADIITAVNLLKGFNG